MQKNYPLLHEKDQHLVYEALHYMKVAELRDCCHKLALTSSGKKGELIERIMHFIKTGSVKELSIIPSTARAYSYPPQPLAKESLMLHGSYKNDAATRLFFKSLIGPHFHFTAFGIDWLNNQWLQGKPPTYQQFANYWNEENERRKKHKVPPKSEWAYITFLQQAQKLGLSKAEILSSWKKLRTEKVAFINTLIKNAS